MAFEMQVVSHAPLTSEQDPERLAKLFFSMIGYTARKGPDHGISFKVFYECFLLHPTKLWTVEELATACGTTLPSIYRHINKLRELDLIEDLHIEQDGGEDGPERKRAFRLRYGDLGKAWTFAESHFQLAVQSYRKTVDHLEQLLRERRQAAPAAAAPAAAKADGVASPPAAAAPA
ncbi:MAG TPA: helix-turn-helix domain-containing protein [Candidatus Thermoplasmatota archaeon]|nr:helix-turn-helix domain-containing protein [Candidatus Thermoplasmatota archaeon]